MIDSLKEALIYQPRTGSFVWRHSGKTAGGRVGNGYYNLTLRGKTYGIHRLVWLFETGEWPIGEVDHIDRDTSNNLFSNLRLANKSQNRCNAAAYKNNRSGLKGIYFNKRRGKWCAQICFKGTKHHLGTFQTKEEAHAAYCKAAPIIHGEFARVA